MKKTLPVNINMNENQLDLVIYHNLHDKRDFYMGSFASDELGDPSLQICELDDSSGKDLKTCFSFIANTLERNFTGKISPVKKGKMGHWLALFVQMTRKKISLKFADSFKMPYSYYGEHIENYIDQYRDIAADYGLQLVFEEMPFRMQQSNSYLCGGYAAYTVLGLKNCNSDSLRKIFSVKFDSKNKRMNDKIVENFVIKKWPKSFCSDIFSKGVKTPFCLAKVFKTEGCLKKCRFGSQNCCGKVRHDNYISMNIKQILQ